MWCNCNGQVVTLLWLCLSDSEWFVYTHPAAPCILTTDTGLFGLLWTLLFLAQKSTHKHRVFLFHLLSHHFSTSLFLTFCTSFHLFFISVSRPMLFIISLRSALPGLERLPWRQKQIWCRDEKWIIQSGKAMCVWLCAEECFCRF